MIHLSLMGDQTPERRINAILHARLKADFVTLGSAVVVGVRCFHLAVTTAPEAGVH